MCTVLFIPDTNKMFFASLRDESPLRPTAITPQLIKKDNLTILSPQDTLAGGTWLGINDYKNIIILLNGGFENHEQKKDYRKSRGLIVSELLQSEMPIIDWELMKMEGIEQFTLIVWSDEILFKLVWDGSIKHRIKLDSKVPHIFSSSTLYSAQTKNYREELFQNWIAGNPVITKQSLLKFFNSVNNNENGFIINRNELVKTLSYSFIELTNKVKAEFDYYDLIHSSHSNMIIYMKENMLDYLTPEF